MNCLVSILFATFKILITRSPAWFLIPAYLPYNTVLATVILIRLNNLISQNLLHVV